MAEVTQSGDGELWDAVVKRLIEKVDGLTETNCFLCDEEVPQVVPMSLPALTVSMQDATFNPDYYSGGGAGQLLQETRFGTTVLMRPNLDTPGKSKVAFINPNTGILTRWKPKIIKALCRQCDTLVHPVRPWLPDVGGLSITVEGIHPVSATKPTLFPVGENEERLLCMSIIFECLIDYDSDQ